jgi:hypothetical protein
MAIAEQWERLADAYEAGKAIKERFAEMTRSRRATRSARRRRTATREAAMTRGRERLSKRTTKGKRRD